MSAIKQASLRLTIVDGVSKPAKLIGATLKGLNAAVTSFNNQRIAANAAFMDSVTGAAAFAVSLALPIRQAMRFEDALADFNKLANLTPPALKAMGGQFVALSKEIPLTTEELLAIGSAVASTGAPLDQVIERVRMISKASVAWGMSTEQAGEALSKIQTGLGLTNAQTEQLANTINYLGNSTAAEAPAIVDYQKRVGALGKMAGLTAEQTAALGASVISMGVESDVAATGVQALLRSLTRGEAATAAQEKAFKRLGLTATETATALQVDADGTIIDVLERLRALPADERLSVANQLFGDEGRPILALIDQIDVLKKNLADATDTTKTAGSVQDEYNGAINTTSQRLKLLRNRVTAASKAFGETLLPAVDQGAGSLGGFADKVEAFVKANPEMVRRVTATAAGLVAVRVAATGARMALFNILRPTNLLIAGLGYLAYQNFDQLQAALRDLVALGRDLSQTAFARSFLEGAASSLEQMGVGAQKLVSALKELTAEGSGLRAWLDSLEGAGVGAGLGSIAVGLGAVLASAALLRPILKPLGLLVRLVGKLAGFGAGLLNTGKGLKEVGQAAGAAAAATSKGRGGKVAATAATIPDGNSRKGGGLGSWLGNALMLWNAYDLVAGIPSDGGELQKMIAANKARSAAWDKWLSENVGTPRQWAGVPDKAAGAPPSVYAQLATDNARNARAAGMGGTTDTLPGKTADDLALNVQAPVDTTVQVNIHGVMVEQVLDVVRKTARQVVDQAMGQMQSALNQQLGRSQQTQFSGVKPYGD